MKQGRSSQRAAERASPGRGNATGFPTVGDVRAAMESIAPPGLAQDRDHVGLLAGDPAQRVRNVLLCIDLTAEVVSEADGVGAKLVIAYHPPIFKPIYALRADSPGIDRVVYQCVRRGIAIYAPHTALDAAEGGTNDTLAALCGVARTEPLEQVPQPGVDNCKLVVMVPAEQVETVAAAMFEAGAGRIGDYSRCSFRAAGTGTFLGGESTDPAVGRRGRMESVDEIRLETIVPAQALSAVVTAMVAAHPYEEPAFDIYPLRSRPVPGVGRIGTLTRETTLSRLARKLKRATHARIVQIVGAPDQRIDRVVVVAGAAGQLPFRVSLRAADAIVTGEIRHHDALHVRRMGCAAIALGHWGSERPVLRALAARLKVKARNIDVRISEADADPFAPV